MPSSTATVRVPTASSSARSCEISSSEPGKLLQRGLQRLAALEVEVVGRLVEDQDVGAGVHEDGQREPPPLAAREPVERLLGRLAAEQELAQQRARLVRLQPGRALGRLEHGARALGAQLLRVLGEQPDLDVVPAPQLARRQLARAGERVDQRRLAGAVGADQRHVLAALEPQLEVLEQRALADPQRAVLDLEDHAARALGRLEREAERLAVARVALDLARSCRASSRATAPGARACPRGSGRRSAPAARSRPPASRSPARAPARAPPAPCASACQVPLKNFARPRLELEHRGADRLQEPAVVRHEHDGGVERLQVALEPLQRLDVEVVGRLVEEQQVGVAGQRAGQRGARQLAAGEGLRGCGPGRSSRKPSPCSVALMRLAPVVAAGVLEPGLRGGVGVERGGRRCRPRPSRARARPGAPRARAGPWRRRARSRAG